LPALTNQTSRRHLGDAMPAVMLLAVVATSAVVLCLLGMVLWLS
jgi:hypothetical protein